ncbi:DNA-binding protein [Acinetobacter larvae]|uniref:DNA-binding protein n=1 Tax=Acinetobacter larvae TaxID=1789224 RepID=A0A1B2LZD2_9GAMM|nr:DNA-binding protein [Acinetobacter larvae]AOA58295.1 DNA-binding protein [Acinetobacter larvae]
MGVQQYIVILEANTPPQITLGQNICGATVTKLEKAKQELVTAAQLAKMHNISVDTIRRKLSSINQGTIGKALYDPELASGILQGASSKRGRKRAS